MRVLFFTTHVVLLFPCRNGPKALHGFRLRLRLQSFQQGLLWAAQLSCVGHGQTLQTGAGRILGKWSTLKRLEDIGSIHIILFCIFLYMFLKHGLKFRPPSCKFSYCICFKPWSLKSGKNAYARVSNRIGWSLCKRIWVPFLIGSTKPWTWFWGLILHLLMHSMSCISVTAKFFRIASLAKEVLPLEWYGPSMAIKPASSLTFAILGWAVGPQLPNILQNYTQFATSATNFKKSLTKPEWNPWFFTPPKTGHFSAPSSCHNLRCFELQELLSKRTVRFGETTPGGTGGQGLPVTSVTKTNGHLCWRKETC